ncbi:hypothetical protein [Glycomyces xiaoerkulensis]|uniref:hypothetical protein n=1 Tax=Glycomyces xiaoerkulensis TaxID=2038139 RepID=UPI000C2573F8|nr:hypothetical protein [Glycomyces xiaoerkulensis]
METTARSKHTTADAIGWVPVASAAYAQAAAFASAAVLAFLVTDASAAFGAAGGSRLWPLGVYALGLAAAANATRQAGPVGRARYSGSAALAGLTLSAAAVALAPSFAFLLVVSLPMGVAAGLVIAIAGRVLVAARVGDGTGSVALSALAALAGVGAGAGALAALPAFGWRGVFGLVVVAAGLAAWKFAEHAPPE